MSVCNICPRACSVDRSAAHGFCRSGESFEISKIMLHKWEEPCICQDGGAGTVFFSGCNLACIFCQNRKISRGGGRPMTEYELEREIFSLCESDASCIEFVTPTHFARPLASLLSRIKDKIDVPTVYNSGGYDSVETLKMLDGLIDIYMPDFKYYAPEIAKKYSSAPDYRDIATAALHEMLRQVGKPRSATENTQKMLGGVIVRHLVLPSHRQDSVEVLNLIAREIGADNVILSLMGQYTPDFYIEYEKEHGINDEYKSLRRKITSFEYNSVLAEAERLGFRGYMQDMSAANAKFTPEF